MNLDYYVGTSLYLKARTRNEKKDPLGGFRSDFAVDVLPRRRGGELVLRKAIRPRDW